MDSGRDPADEGVKAFEPQFFSLKSWKKSNPCAPTHLKTTPSRESALAKALRLTEPWATIGDSECDHSILPRKVRGYISLNRLGHQSWTLLLAPSAQGKSRAWWASLGGIFSEWIFMRRLPRPHHGHGARQCGHCCSNGAGALRQQGWKQLTFAVCWFLAYLGIS